MAGALVAARVDADVKRMADYYIERAGETQASVIRAVWSNIAATGKLPMEDKGSEHAEELNDRLRLLRAATPPSSHLENLTPQDLKKELSERG